MAVEQVIKLTDLNPGDKVLDIERYIEAEFTIWRYQAGHSVMIIQMEPKGKSDYKDIFYLCFESVEYFDGPMRWDAADLYIAPYVECADILKKIKVYSQISYDLLPLHFRLVKVDTNHNLQVKIVTSSVTITQDISSYIL